MFGKKIQANKAKELVNLVLMGAIAFPSVTISFFITLTKAIALDEFQFKEFFHIYDIDAAPRRLVVVTVDLST